MDEKPPYCLIVLYNRIRPNFALQAIRSSLVFKLDESLNIISLSESLNIIHQAFLDKLAKSDIAPFGYLFYRSDNEIYLIDENGRITLDIIDKNIPWFEGHSLETLNLFLNMKIA